MISTETMKRMSEDEARDIANSSFWLAVKRELDYRIMSKLMAMKSCTAEEVRFLQREIKVYEEMIGLPEAVMNRESNKGPKQ